MISEGYVATVQPGSPSFTRAIVLAQMLAQLGAFALPALLPSYIERWSLSAIEAGWLVGIFFAAYVVMVPMLVDLPPEKWTPGYAVLRSACSGVM
jgi:hypothetical protein